MTDAALTGVIRDLAVAAGGAIMEVYARPIAVSTKSDASPLTEADLAADEIICAGLAKAFPGIPFVTEERAGSHDLAGAETHFLVDPLDGTKEFVNRRDEFTVNIALIKNGRPAAGVVYAPALGRLFRTDPAGGAVEESGYLSAGALTVRPIAARELESAALRVVASRSHRDPETDAFIARYDVAEIKSAGSSLKFCLLATGEADLYPRLGPTMEWDTAAAQAVLEAAGGCVLRLDDGAPLRYGGLSRRNPAFVALAPGVPLRLS